MTAYVLSVRNVHRSSQFLRNDLNHHKIGTVLSMTDIVVFIGSIELVIWKIGGNQFRSCLHLFNKAAPISFDSLVVFVGDISPMPHNLWSLVTQTNWLGIVGHRLLVAQRNW